MSRQPLSAEQVAAALAPTCRLSTLEALSKLAGMTFNNSSFIAPECFFWNAQDTLWLLGKGLIIRSRYGYAITTQGKATIAQLTTTLAQLNP